jgi:hypothetical protein
MPRRGEFGFKFLKSSVINKQSELKGYFGSSGRRDEPKKKSFWVVEKIQQQPPLGLLLALLRLLQDLNHVRCNVQRELLFFLSQFAQWA